ncbi:MAG: AAA family ATPase [Deltaproteobacteria bacterium]|jgi:predicted ATPase|nr:AAA family ATPase [Deltaproteobacteria bacterium]
MSIAVKEVSLRNVLSFGPQGLNIGLGSLNILIGPNGSGKSNLIEIFALLRSCPGDLRDFITRNGGVSEWIWKGEPGGVASVDAVIAYPQGPRPLRHVVEFHSWEQRFSLDDERIERERPDPGKSDVYFYYRYLRGHPVVNVAEKERRLAPESVETDRSILAQRDDREVYPELFYLASIYKKLKIYKEWTFGRKAIFREPQKADMRNDRLEEDFSNLGLFLNRLRKIPKAKNAILEGLRDLYEEFCDFDISVEGGTVQVFFTEGDFIIPATRLSDGTLRYLCLLAVLCDPDPPPLVCIEEPELGLHPDILPKLADRLVDASQRTQLIVTTHSDILVDAMSERPDAVIVCEKHSGWTTMERLSEAKLSTWLQQYRLGELWTRGELGGTRW